jgi:hypothetical protein
MLASLNAWLKRNNYAGQLWVSHLPTSHSPQLDGLDKAENGILVDFRTVWQENQRVSSLIDERQSFLCFQ